MYYLVLSNCRTVRPLLWALTLTYHRYHAATLLTIQDIALSVSGTLEWKNPFGYLEGEAYGYLFVRRPFLGSAPRSNRPQAYWVLFIMYCIVIFYYAFMMFYYRANIIKLQFVRKPFSKM